MRLSEHLIPVIQVEELTWLGNTDNPIIINASGSPDAHIKYKAKHLDGALFLDLNADLSEIPEDAADGGRHPLPKIENFARMLAGLGISPESHVVIYDDTGGANASARFWWMLKAIGHEKVQVLNGGIQEAERQGFPINSDVVQPNPAAPYPIHTLGLPSERDPAQSATREQKDPLHPSNTWILPMAKIEEVERASQDPGSLVVDVRATPRYNGEFEPLDLIAGHIPGAKNIPFTENLHDGSFKSSEKLNKKYSEVFGDIPSENIIFHCGSGVTACHSLLAIAHAGLELPKLYVGSWSEWSRNGKPIATNV